MFQTFDASTACLHHSRPWKQTICESCAWILSSLKLFSTGTFVIRVTVPVKTRRPDVTRGSRLGLSTTSGSSCERSFTLESEKRLVSKKRGFIRETFYFEFCPARDLFRNVRAIIAILRTTIYRRIRVTVNRNTRRKSESSCTTEISSTEMSNFSSSKYLPHFFVFNVGVFFVYF